MRALGRLLLLPFQVAATLLLLVVGLVILGLQSAADSEPLSQIAGYVLRGDEDAFRRHKKREVPDWVDAAFRWTWRPRFMKPKGPTVF